MWKSKYNFTRKSEIIIGYIFFLLFFTVYYYLKTIVLEDTIVRGDLAAVKIGRHCLVGKHCVIRPPFKKFSSGYLYIQYD